MIKVAVVEDNKVDQNRILNYLMQYQEENNIVIDTTVFNDGSLFIQDYQANWDIVFLDIEMPGLDGMTTAEKIRAVDTKVIIIFVTNMVQYAIKGYEVDALDFVIKPVEYPLFAMKFRKSISMISTHTTKAITLKQGAGYRKIDISGIYYAVVYNHKLQIHLSNETVEGYGSITELESKISDIGFSRCNNGCLVNMGNIKKIDKDTVYMLNGDELAISRGHKQDFQKDFARFLGGSFK